MSMVVRMIAVMCVALLAVGAGKSKDRATYLKYDDMVFPLRVEFPHDPISVEPIPLDLRGSSGYNPTIYSFLDTDEEEGITYAVSVNYFPREMGTIDRAVASEMVLTTINGQLATGDVMLESKFAVEEYSSKDFDGCPSIFIELTRDIEVGFFGVYRTLFVDRCLITVFASGLNTTSNRASARSFVGSMELKRGDK